MFDNNNKGALWLAKDKATGQQKLTKTGESYWTGTITINGIKYLATMFHTKSEAKKNPNQPDFNILIKEPQMAQATSSPQYPPMAAQAVPPQSYDNMNIPF